MKKTILQSALGGALIAAALMITPVAAFALDSNATTTSSFRISQGGITHVIGAEVTSVTGNIVNAVTRIRNTVISWAFATDATTKIVANNSVTASTTDIRTGDRINVTGTIAAIGSTMNVQATAIKDVTSMKQWKARTGAVQSVNTTNGTFVLKSNDKLVTIQTNTQTAWKTNATGTVSLATLSVGSKLAVTGQSTVDGSVITASSVLVKVANDKKKDDSKKNRDNLGKHKEYFKKNFGFNFGDM